MNKAEIDYNPTLLLLLRTPSEIPKYLVNTNGFFSATPLGMANSSDVNANGHAAHLADEETPLLNDQAKPSNGVNDGNTDEPVEEVVIVEEISNRKLVFILGTVYIGVFLGALDSTIMATLASPISSSFSSQSLFAWLASAYLIANAACQPISGRLTDIYSRGTGLLISNILFGAGTLLCGLAKEPWVMILARVIAGMGGGGLMAISTFLASDLVPLRKRGIMQGIGNICYGTGAGLGGVFGGWINDVWGWRTAFLVQVPLIVISAILVYIVVDIPAKKSTESKLSRVDFSGAILLIVTLVLLLLGLNSGGNLVPWTSPLVLTALSLSFVALIVFIYVESCKKAPVLPVKLLLDRTVMSACLSNWFSTMLVFMVLFYAPIYFQAEGLSTTQAGLRLIPQSIGSSIGSLCSGVLMKRTGKYKVLGLVVVALQLLGTGLFATWDSNKPDWPIYIFLSLIGCGYGGMLTVNLLAVIAAVDHKDQATVTSATYAFRSTGSTIGVTIASAVYQNILKAELWQKFGGREGAADVIKRIRDSFDEINHLPLGWKQGVRDTYGDAIRSVFLTATGIGVLALVCQAFVQQHTLHSNLARRQSQ